MTVEDQESTVFAAISEFTSALKGDSTKFIKKAQAPIVGVARDCEPARLYVIRIDNWFETETRRDRRTRRDGQGVTDGTFTRLLRLLLQR
jgi:hypothetical protein